ncbi:hypothetical protein K466DRAFT_259422 [Polyporus arcularius HHB13444]|uniref:Uncharacterized protein n=1 Tax=Polyporus arcularius HHB13444 TaxID=1314778 RepID=A0A5C3P5D9_9APHY|nr:hypothetical protein K466DRAFT_259422 [Polyporus arcularius HHB13444]
MVLRDGLELVEDLYESALRWVESAGCKSTNESKESVALTSCQTQRAELHLRRRGLPSSSYLQQRMRREDARIGLTDFNPSRLDGVSSHMGRKAVSMLGERNHERNLKPPTRVAQAAFGDLELLDGSISVVAAYDGGSDGVLLVRMGAQGSTSRLPTTGRVRRLRFRGRSLRLGSFKPLRRPL